MRLRINKKQYRILSLLTLHHSTSHRLNRMDATRIETLKIRGYEDDDIATIAQYADSNGISNQGSLDSAIQGAGFSLDINEYKKQVEEKKKLNEANKVTSPTSAPESIKIKDSESGTTTTKRTNK